MFKDENAKKVDTISAIISQNWRILSSYFRKNKKKYYKQIHKKDYILFASVIRSFWNPFGYPYRQSVEFWFTRYNITLGLKNKDNHKW